MRLSDVDPLCNKSQVKAAVGGVSDMCIWRWQRDERVQFPMPDVTINGRNYWRASTVRAWQERMTVAPKVQTNRPPQRVEQHAA